jgi:hypothetical protein
MPLYFVDTIVQERHRYVIEAKSLEHAYDEVTMRRSGHPADHFIPLSMLDLGETILDGREITVDDLEKEMARLNNGDPFIEPHHADYDPADIIRKINYDV